MATGTQNRRRRSLELLGRDLAEAERQVREIRERLAVAVPDALRSGASARQVCEWTGLSRSSVDHLNVERVPATSRLRAGVTHRLGKIPQLVAELDRMDTDAVQEALRRANALMARFDEADGGFGRSQLSTMRVAALLEVPEGVVWQLLLSDDVATFDALRRDGQRISALFARARKVVDSGRPIAR